MQSIMAFICLELRSMAGTGPWPFSTVLVIVWLTLPRLTPSFLKSPVLGFNWQSNYDYQDFNIFYAAY